MAMELYHAEVESQGRRLWRLAKLLCAAAPFILAAFFCLYFHAQIDFSRGQFPIYLTFSAVNLILAGTYFYTYKFFADNFYFFIAVSWLANAIYVLLDLSGPRYFDSGLYSYRLGIELLTLSSNAFLLLALLSIGIKKLARVKWIMMGASVVVIIYLNIAFLFALQLPERSDINLTKLTLPGTAISFFLLCAVGAVISDRLKGENVNWTRRTILFTFYTYAVLQLFSPVFIYLQVSGSSSVLSLYLISLLAKVGNAIAMQGVLQSVMAIKDEKVKYEVNVRRAELEIAEAQLKRRSQLAELGTLAASIKHDINNPLITMSFEIGVLKQIYQHDRRLLVKLGNLEASMERIHAIVNVVDIIRGDRAFFAREEFMSKVNVLEIVHRAVRAIKNEREELKQLNPKNFIKVEGRDVYVRAYAPMFEQVVVNIIKNGLDAIEEAECERGLIKINVSSTELASENISRWAKVEIEDNGVGIPAENLIRLFTVFTTKGHKKPNSGIGLFISKRIVDIHEGRITFDSKVSEGTRVSILLPEWNALKKAGLQDPENSLERDAELTSDEDLRDEEPKPETSQCDPAAGASDLGEKV